MVLGEDLLAEHREDLALSSPSLDMASRLAVLQSRAMRVGLTPRLVCAEA